MILRLVIQNNIHTYFVDCLACSTRSLEHFGFMAVIHSFRMMIHIRHKIKLFPRHICHLCQFYLEHPNAKHWLILISRAAESKESRICGLHEDILTWDIFFHKRANLDGPPHCPPGQVDHLRQWRPETRKSNPSATGWTPTSTRWKPGLRTETCSSFQPSRRPLCSPPGPTTAAPILNWPSEHMPKTSFDEIVIQKQRQ